MGLTNGLYARVVVCFLVCSIAVTASAVPYASSVRNMGTTWEFVLNEAADSVTVLRDGGNAIDLGAIGPGRHTFDMMGFSSFEIQVQKSAPTGWTALSDSANLFTNFERPYGLAVNTDASSPFFGTVYVNNSTNLTTATGRTMGDGIYALTADLVGVDLANNFAVVSDPNDASQAKAPGWDVGQSTNAAFHISLDEAGNIIAGDWSDASGGIKYASPSLTTGGLILALEDGTRPLLLDPSTNTHEIHGSIVSTPYTTGSVGNNLTVYALDEDYDLDGDTLTATSGNHLWRWNVGNETEYEGAPELVVSASALATANGDGSPAFLNLNIGVLADAFYSPVHDKWYLTQGRNDGNESSVAIVTADGVDGMNPTLEWSSKQFSIDNDLDGFTGDAVLPEGEGLQDIFREIGYVTISPDGTKMYAHRGFVYGDTVENNNVYLGQNSPFPGNVLVIPLDENGIPIVEIDDNGTPEDPLDDVITNFESIDLSANSDYSRVPITLDAAGNVYLTNHVAELLYVFSPGGSTLATTTSDGTFNVVPIEPPIGVPGDYNNNGTVDAADYVLWRSGAALENEVATPGENTAEDYTEWRARFGNTSDSGGTATAAVPEPGTVMLSLLAAAMAGVVRFRRQIA